MKWERFIVVIQPKKQVAEIIRQVWETKDSPSALKYPLTKRKRLTQDVIKVIQLEETIPIEEYESRREVFDSSALQSDDRFFSVTTTGKRYNVSVMNRIKEGIMKKENVDSKPIQL